MKRARRILRMEGGGDNGQEKATEEPPKRGRGRPRKEKPEEVRQGVFVLSVEELASRWGVTTEGVGQ